jgi:predicted benzoate:H+ symporter BenE
LIATADTASNVAHSGIFTLVLATLGVCKVFISAVENDITTREVGHEALEDFVTDTSVGQREDK